MKPTCIQLDTIQELILQIDAATLSLLTDQNCSTFDYWTGGTDKRAEDFITLLKEAVERTRQ
jgi:hypothetical protein